VSGASSLLLASVAVLLASLPLALSVWALLDAARRPGWAWALCCRNQAGWMAAILVGILTVIGGVAVSSFYLLRIRPIVAAAEDGDIAVR
jgi:hypothetical protein